MNKYICECCGGQINRSTMKCEYCGTAYKEEFDNVIRIETFRNPIREYKASIILPNEMVNQLGEKETANFATVSLVGKLAEALKENMILNVENDVLMCGQKVTGYVKIVHPVQISDMERLR